MTSSVDLLDLNLDDGHEMLPENAPPLMPTTFRARIRPADAERAIPFEHVQELTSCGEDERGQMRHIFTTVGDSLACEEHACGRQDPSTGEYFHLLRCGHMVARGDQRHCSEICMNPIWMVDAVVGRHRAIACDFCGPYLREQLVLIHLEELNSFESALESAYGLFVTEAGEAEERREEALSTLQDEFWEEIEADLSASEQPDPRVAEALARRDPVRLGLICQDRIRMLNDHDYDSESDAAVDEDHESELANLDEQGDDDFDEADEEIFSGRHLTPAWTAAMSGHLPRYALEREIRHAWGNNMRFRARLTELYTRRMPRQARIDLFVDLFSPIVDFVHRDVLDPSREFPMLNREPDDNQDLILTPDFREDPWITNVQEVLQIARGRPSDDSPTDDEILDYWNRRYAALAPTTEIPPLNLNWLVPEGDDGDVERNI